MAEGPSDVDVPAEVYEDMACEDADSREMGQSVTEW